MAGYTIVVVQVSGDKGETKGSHDQIYNELEANMVAKLVTTLTSVSYDDTHLVSGNHINMASSYALYINTCVKNLLVLNDGSYGVKTCHIICDWYYKILANIECQALHFLLSFVWLYYNYFNIERLAVCNEKVTA